jgi:carbon storage regulator
MLILSRKTNQQIVIGDNVKLVVVAVNGERVKLEFIAPSNVPIHREEVHRRRQSEQPT